jgi:hypothetical protein
MESARRHGEAVRAVLGAGAAVVLVVGAGVLYFGSTVYPVHTNPAAIPSAAAASTPGAMWLRWMRQVASRGRWFEPGTQHRYSIYTWRSMKRANGSPPALSTTALTRTQPASPHRARGAEERALAFQRESLIAETELERLYWSEVRSPPAAFQGCRLRNRPAPCAPRH